MGKRIICLMVLLVIGIGSAVIPSPHGFEGNIYYSDGTLIQENLGITAKINSVLVGSAVLSNGAYDLVVESESGGTIYFYIDGQSGEIGSYVFDAFAITELDFTTSLSNPDASSSGSGGGSSGGGGGGGSTSSSGGSGSSSSSSSSPIDLGTNDNVETQEQEEISLKPTNQEASGITGALIGFSESGIGIGFVFMLMVLFIGVAIVVLKKTSPKISEAKDEK